MKQKSNLQKKYVRGDLISWKNIEKRKKETLIAGYTNISKLYIVERDEIEDTQPGKKEKTKN